MSEENPLVSIIIPTYNRAHLIGETLDSVLAQTYQNWECIIIDDNSLDKDGEVVKVFAEKDDRFRFYKKPLNRPKGPSASRNYGLEIAKGEFVNFMDSDDLMVSSKLEKDLAAIGRGDFDYTISQSEFFGINEGRKYWNQNLYSSDPLNDFIKKRIGWGINSPLWRKISLTEKHLFFDENLRSGNDFFFHIEAIQKGLKPIVQTEVLVKVRNHQNQIKHHEDKTAFKLEATYKLLSENRFCIDKETERYLYELSLRNFRKAFKHKNFKVLKKYIYNFLKIYKEIEYKRSLLRMLLPGIFYYITSKGYSHI